MRQALAGNRQHRIRVETGDAGKDFAPCPVMPRGGRERLAGIGLPDDPEPLTPQDGSPVLRGENRESRHRQHPGRPVDGS